jgi:hypothetical protein
MINTTVGAVAGAGDGAASRYGSGSDQKRRLLAAPALAPAPQHNKGEAYHNAALATIDRASNIKYNMYRF